MSSWLRSLYGYHAWANDELLGKVEMIREDMHKAERHTAIGLIDHYYGVMRIFAAHLGGARHHLTSDNTAKAQSLSELHAAVAASDQWYLNYVQSISPVKLSESVAFTFTDGDQGYMTREEMLMHVVLHSAIHRGEVCRILAQLSITPPWDTFAVYLHQAEPSRRQQGGGPSVRA